MQTSKFKHSDQISDAIIWDNHACMPLTPGENLFMPDLAKYRRAGVTVVVINITFDNYPWHTGFKMLATFRSWVKKNHDHYLLVDSVEDIARAKKEGKLGIAFNIEGGAAVDDLPELVEPFYTLGVRWMLIAYNLNNRLGGGCQDDDSGLTSFGRKVIDEMEKVGMVLCCSHTGYKTARDVFDYTNQPVIFSHSNPRNLHDHPRNIPDELIRGCAETGGVINLNGVGIFLGENDNTTETFLNHIDYVVQLVGPDHVGLGLDYDFDQEGLKDYIAQNPELYPAENGYAREIKLIEPERISEIVYALDRRGWDIESIIKFLGGNNLRVAEQVWK